MSAELEDVVHHQALLDSLRKGFHDNNMGRYYADVLPTQCLKTPKGQMLAGCFSYLDRHIFTKQTEVWWGKTIMKKSFGKGSVTLYTFHIAETLQRDPVARNIFLIFLSVTFVRDSVTESISHEDAYRYLFFSSSNGQHQKMERKLLR